MRKFNSKTLRLDKIQRIGKKYGVFYAFLYVGNP
jgi:hypothetical protein